MTNQNKACAKSQTFSSLKAAVTGPLMGITTLSNAQFADLTAYLNRSQAAQNCGVPTPVPTPISDLAAGRFVFQVTCQSCHGRPRELRNSSSHKIREAIREEDEMQSIVLSAEQLRVLIIYLASV